MIRYLTNLNPLKTLCFCLLWLLTTAPLIAQIQVRVLGSGESLEDFIPHYTGEMPQAYQLPDVDVEKAKQEDERAPKGIFRFGISSEVQVPASAGEFVEIDRQTVQWQMVFQSPGALSLNFNMSEVNLPEGSEMYVYSPLSKMVQGPITMQEIPNRMLATDLVPGEAAVLLVNMPAKAKKEFSLLVNKATHGYRGQSQRGFGDSESCTVDVNCNLPNSRTTQRDAVGLILFGNSGCSGSLIMNRCRDFSPLFLTAFHCVDGNKNESLSSSERSAVGNWAFRFRYESFNPIPPSCRGSEPLSWVFFSGASVVSADPGSDFALLRLQTPNILTSGLSMAGWNRSSSAPSSTYGIHHPDLDVKKISDDFQSPLVQPPSVPFISPSSTDYWRVSWDNGITAGGSSGGPLFDTDGRIIGQLWGGSSYCSTPQSPDFYGRLSESWTGGGTSFTGLSTFLGLGASTTQMPGYKIPTIAPAGASHICYGAPKTLSVANSPGGTVSWSVSPSHLVTTASGTGSSATVAARTSSSKGEITLTFRINASGCLPIFLSKTLWIGKPGNPTTNPTGYPTIAMSLGELKGVSVTDAPGTSTSFTTWWATGSLDLLGSSTNGSYRTFEANSYGYGNFFVKTANACGFSPNAGGAVNVSQSGGGGGGFGGPLKVAVSPNPAHDEIKLELPSEAPDMRRNVVLMDVHGRIVLEMKTAERSFTLPLDQVAAGVYILRMYAGEEVYSERIVIE